MEKKVDINNLELPYKKFCGDLQEWDPKEFFDRNMREYGAFSGIITGSSRSGKSNLLKYLLVGEPNISKYFDFILVFSKTLCNGFYAGFLDTKLMFSDFDENIINDMKRLYEQKKQEKKKFKWLVILDDIVSARSKYISSIENFFLQGRHFQASLIFLTQKASYMSTSWFANSSFIITLFAGSRNEKSYIAEKIISDNIPEEYAMRGLKQLDQISYLVHTAICQDYQALIILPYERGTKIYKFKAKLMAKDKKKKITSIYENFIKN